MLLFDPAVPHVRGTEFMATARRHLGGKTEPLLEATVTVAGRKVARQVHGTQGGTPLCTVSALCYLLWREG